MLIFTRVVSRNQKFTLHIVGLIELNKTSWLNLVNL